MRCNVKIKGAEDAEEVSSFGELTFTNGGFNLNYSIAGDRCVLTACGTTITQSRRGSTDMDITFAKGKNTVCMLLSGELTGSIPVKTTALSISKREDEVSVVMEYLLGGAKIFLSLTAVVIH